MSAGRLAPAASPFRQPKGVWAVAFACVVSFMGIGLVDPILPALSSQLHASPPQVELLFTSYLVVTAVAMLVTGWVSSRIGGKRTLVAGLVLIVAFSALAGSSDTIGGIIGFRAGWGLGNALFIATSLAVIIGAASGGFSGAIILYETALGVGIALGPLVGGELGAISWRGPFFGVTVLMAISLIATIVFVDATPSPKKRTSLLDPIKALRHRGLATMSFAALCYNWGFFTLLAYTPFPMHLSIHQLGYVFTGWGILVAIFAVFVAQRLQRRFGTPNTLYVSFAVLSIILIVIGAGTSSQLTLIIAVIASGAIIGLNNTLTTQAVMLVAPVERPVASAAYGFVRFIGGGLAPYVASRLVTAFNVHVPFYVGAGAVALAIVVLSTGHKLLVEAESGDADAPREPEWPGEQGARVVAAVDGTPESVRVTDAAIGLAASLGSPVDVLHVLETGVVGDDAADAETDEAARRIVADHVARVRAAGLTGDGHVLRAVGDHAANGSRIAAYARDHHARAVVVGTAREPGFSALVDADVTDVVVRESHCRVLVVPMDDTERPAQASSSTSASAR
ncbi:MAG TPA: MFS transporter [Pseudonocardiaceae bacterium]|jgi:MFS family permease|nr:MFS transporter [Pseudonocardiaceae bacterium]